MNLRGALVAIALPLLFLTACGDDTGADDASMTDGEASETATPSAPPSSADPSTEPSESNPPPEAPACATVWQGGKKLPAPYVGCYEGEEFLAPTQQMCGFGKPLVTYADTFYAVPGGRIHETSEGLDKDKGYARDHDSCTA